jgi:two-component system, NtrC family, sensor kinase
MNPVRIVIVEDEAILAQDLSRRLADLGHTVVGIADNGPAAITMAAELKPGLMLLDIGLKGKMDGIAAADEIRRSTHTPFVYMTAHSDPVTLERAKATEPFGYMIKPVEDYELRSTIEIALARVRLEWEIQENRRWLSTVLGSIGDGVITTDTGGSVTYLNPVAEQLTGWQRLAATGKQISEVLCSQMDGALADVCESISTVLHDGQTVGPVAARLHCHDKGRATPITMIAAPIRNESNGIEGVVVVCRDVTVQERTQRELEIQKLYFQTLFDRSPDAIAVVDERNIIKDSNTAFERVFQYSAAESRGSNIDELISAEDQRAEANLASDTVLTSGYFEGIGPRKRKDGKTITVSVVGSRVWAEGGKALVYAVYRDITEEKRRNERLLQLSRAVEQSPVSIVITDQSGTIEYVNPKFTQATGYSFEEAIDSNPRILKGGGTSSKEYEELWSTITTGREWAGVFHNRRKDGTHFWESAKISPVMDSSGTVVNYVAVKEDITERRLMEDAMVASEREFRQVWEHSLDGMRVMDANGFILKVNEAFCRIVRMQPEDLLRKHYSVIFAPPYQAAILARNHGRLDLSGLKAHLERDVTLWDGTHLCLELSNSVLQREDGSATVLSIARDITERRRLEQQVFERNKDLEAAMAKMRQMQGSLVQSEKMASIGQLTAGIAHEINNPLAFVSSNINRFQEYFQDAVGLASAWKEFGRTMDDSLKYREALAALKAAEESADLEFITTDFNTLMKHTREGADRIRHIVEQLRGFSHLSDSSFGEASINQLLDDTVTVTWNELKYKVTLQRDYGTLPLVQCNAGELKQVFVNLLVNATHAIEKTGMITLTTRHDADTVVIVVRDTGCGIPKDKLNRIFDPFYTTKPVGKGTGLGLWIVSSIIERHHGMLTVESEVGQGTAFTITLPIAPRKNGGHET